MSERDALLHAVCENPDDDTPRLVFADWLEERGEADRAEFIRLQINIAVNAASAEEHAREKELLERHHREWTGSFVDFESDIDGHFYIFRRGFIEAISSEVPIMLSGANRLFALAPIRELLFHDIQDTDEFAAVAKCEWLLRLHTLDLTGSTLGFSYPAPLIQSPYLANLKTLRLGGEDDNGHLDQAGIGALLAARHLNGVETLDLGGNWLDAFEPNTFALFLTQTNLPALRTLNLARVGIDDDGVQALAATPWARNLKSLDLRWNSVGELGARAILESPLLAGLEHLDLSKNSRIEDEQDGIWPETRERLKQRFAGRVVLPW